MRAVGGGTSVLELATIRGSGRPTLQLNFVTTSTLDPRITFTRASSDTYFDSAGVMQTASTNVARFNYLYNGSAWEPAGLLVEPAATNLLLRSREFDNASWAKTDTTVTANAATGVGGTATMDLVTEGTVGSQLLAQTVTITANATYTFTMDLKRGSHDWVCITAFDDGSTANFIRGWFNLNTGAVGSATNGGTGSGAAVSITNLGNGIYRCALTGAVNNSVTSVRFCSLSATADASVTRINSSTRYQDRAQLEAGSVATSYIATAGSTATRAADVAVISGTAFSDWFNPLEGTFVWEGDTARILPAGLLFAASDGTTSERIYASNTSFNGLLVVDGGVTQANIAPTAPSLNTTFKRAVAYKANDFAISHNGAAPGTDTSGTLPTVNRLHIGADQGSSSQLNGHIRRLTYYPTRLSDAQLATLSTL